MVAAATSQRNADIRFWADHKWHDLLVVAHLDNCELELALEADRRGADGLS
jgi:hypothetical protein